MLKRVDGWVLLYLKRNQNNDSSGCKLNTKLNSEKQLK
ncbi:hypothetical protein NIES25_64200 (plasmid) [Nostoc linckia NIES-25]|nr:hypothetical protein NIES25_64200 [Nostoc linckia NIES-25]